MNKPSNTLASAPIRSNHAPVHDPYFMAGRAGCRFVEKAIEQHTLQKKTVVELDCPGKDTDHPVCHIQAETRRGTPMYYKQTGPDAYDVVHRGYTENLSFLP